MKKLILAILLTAFASTAHAAAGWLGNLKICTIDPAPSGEVFVNICGGYTPKECTAANWIKFRLDDPNGPEMYSNALLAFAMEKSVQVYVPAQPNCTSSYDRVDRLRPWQ